jgi:hypothetical protein
MDDFTSEMSDNSDADLNDTQLDADEEEENFDEQSS